MNPPSGSFANVTICYTNVLKFQNSTGLGQKQEIDSHPMLHSTFYLWQNWNYENERPVGCLRQNLETNLLRYKLIFPKQLFHKKG